MPPSRRQSAAIGVGRGWRCLRGAALVVCAMALAMATGFGGNWPMVCQDTGSSTQEPPSLTFIRRRSKTELSREEQRPRGWWRRVPRATFTAWIGVAGVVGWLGWRQVLQARQLKRPYVCRDLSLGACPVDPVAELTKVVVWIQDEVLRPIDERLPGRPFEYDLQSFPFTPMVLVIGNHSSGKSTFINRMLGRTVQETGVAPTDDGFTVLERSKDHDHLEDGPTLIGCPFNRPFRELQRFGQHFSGHLRRKRIVLPANAQMPFGLQIVDTPGMIDVPHGQDNPSHGRGYNFVKVVRWWAKRSDLVLLLFDPDKPGTTGETLDVLTQSLMGLEHKFIVILNKVDQLDNSVDFARTYGTLGWALSKVIARKDIPLIYTTYTDVAGVKGQKARSKQGLDLDAFENKTNEVVEEVQRARLRHWDNVITQLEETLRQAEMTATITTDVRQASLHRRIQVGIVAFVVLLGVPFAAQKWSETSLSEHSSKVITGVVVFYLLVCFSVGCFLREYCRQFERLQLSNLDTIFETSYKRVFIHTEGEDTRMRWALVRPKVSIMLRSLPTATALPVIARWEAQRCDEVLGEDIWYLRQLAKLLRDPSTGALAGGTKGSGSEAHAASSLLGTTATAGTPVMEA